MWTPSLSYNGHHFGASPQLEYWNDALLLVTHNSIVPTFHHSN
jgi:hypothetical protein